MVIIHKLGNDGVGFKWIGRASVDCDLEYIQKGQVVTDGG